MPLADLERLAKVVAAVHLHLLNSTSGCPQLPLVLQLPLVSIRTCSRRPSAPARLPDVSAAVGCPPVHVDPLVTKGASLVPMLGIDVWEHAYYLQYKNVRLDYLNNIWMVMNWKYAGEVYENVLA